MERTPSEARRDAFRDYIQNLDNNTLIRLIYTTSTLLNYKILNTEANAKSNFDAWFNCSNCQRIITLPDFYTIWSTLYTVYYENLNLVRAIANHNANPALSDELRHELSALENAGQIPLDYPYEKVFKCIALVNLTYDRLTNGPPIAEQTQADLRYTLNRQELRGLFGLDFVNRYCNCTFAAIIELTDELFNEVYSLFINL